MPLQPGQQLGPYRLVRRLGAGGMGEVYEAVHDRIARKVAIKVLHAEVARQPEVAGRFLNEARAVNIVHHPGLVEVFDHGQLPDGTTYIVMEYLGGETLSQYLERHGGRLPEPQVLYFGQQIAVALAAAHGKGIVHRDLKPGNVMLVPDASFPGGRRVKLLDFGIAKVGLEYQAPEGDLVKTSAGVFLGSPLYMSPEQCHNAGTVSPQSDVYSFGVMLYHLLSGAPPFSADSAAMIVGMHLYEKPAPLAAKAQAVSPALGALVDSMLRKAPGERPTMAETAQALARCLREKQPKLTSFLTLRRSLAIGLANSLVSLGAVFMVLDPLGLRRSDAIARCNAAGFCQEPLPSEVGRLRSVVAFSEDDVWASGDGGLLVHYDGKGWQVARRGLGHRLHQLFGFHGGDVWAVGDNGTLLHYDGKAWSRIPDVSAAYLTGIFGASPSDLWIVGKAREGAAELLHFDGASWQAVPSGTENNLLSIWGPRKDLIWAVGHKGTVLRYDGKGWRPVDVGMSQKLTGVWGTSDSDVWVVGHGGLALHFDGKTWTPVPTGTNQDINSVFGSGREDVWLVGNQGLVLHFDGKRLDKVDSGVSADLESVCRLPMPGRRHVFAVGSSGTLLHRRD